ncbi:MAG TPA: class I SAM-dependent methyltransferase [Pirellulales bacterium]|nr:class I SAM-dependent methyltransferase [Pirellulales bacterium]
MLSQTELDPRLRERIDSERRYHDEHYRSTSEAVEISFDLATDRRRRPHNLSWAHYDTLLDYFAHNLAGKRILEVGCGTGNVALNLAKQGALVDACDVSEEAIAICRRRAEHHRLEGVNFRAVSMEDMELQEEGYDAVVGTMVLHHIDIPSAADKIFRLLKPRGLGVFAEWKEYPGLDRVRRAAVLRALFPPGGVEGYATEHERKLSPSDFKAIQARFPDVALEYRYCLCGKVQYFSPKWAAKLEPLDYRLLCMLPALRWFTDGVVIKFTKPRPSSSPRHVAEFVRIPAEGRNGSQTSHEVGDRPSTARRSDRHVKETPNRRFVLLAGTARSGTTWLGNILNSSPRSVYSHEPLMRYADGDLQPLLTQIKTTGRISHDEREVVLDHWSRAYFAVRRPPFFKKEYSAWPAQAPWAAWLTVRGVGRGYRAFQYLFSPADHVRYDLVVKQGGLSVHGPNFVRALVPDALVVILRHPCEVIASVRRGQRLGLMRNHNRERWFDDHLALAEEFGYGRREVEAMSDAEFEALDWLIENSIYQRLVDDHPNAQLVVYRDLFRDPKGVTETLFEALGWEVTKQTRRFLRDTTTRQTSRLTSLVTASHSYFSVYRPGKESIDAWRHELSRREQEEILEVARPLLERYWPVEE